MMELVIHPYLKNRLSAPWQRIIIPLAKNDIQYLSKIYFWKGMVYMSYIASTFQAAKTSVDLNMGL